MSIRLETSVRVSVNQHVLGHVEYPIGGSDRSFRLYSAKTGLLLWSASSMEAMERWLRANYDQPTNGS